MRRTEEEKLAALEAFRNRGDRPVREISEELGISVQMLYHWEKRLREGEGLGRKNGKTKKTTSAKKAPAAAIVVAKRPAQHIEIQSRATVLPREPRDHAMENVLLRQEIQRLKRMLAAALD